MTDPASSARRMWALFESVHVTTYFAAEARDAFEQAGLRGFWRGYFAGRSAPLGPAGPAAVIAAFCSFAPAMIARALPAVWELITPSAALAARELGAVAAIRRLLGLAASEPAPGAVAQAAGRLAEAASGLDITGRVLGGSNTALPVPDEPIARLWHAATVLREHRGDGHVAALVAASLDGCESVALRAGVDQVRAAGGGAPVGWSRAQIQPMRGWTDAEWAAATARLADRGLLANTGRRTEDATALRPATPAGMALYQDVEAATDRAAARPWTRLGDARTSDLATLLEPISRACAAVIPARNPVGLPTAAAG